MEFEAVTVHVQEDGGICSPGRITGLRHTREGVSMGLVFPAGEGPALPLRRAAQLVLKGGPFPAEVEVAALVTSRYDNAEHDTYDLRFPEGSQPLLSPLFEMREIVRVPPAAGTAVTVVLRRREGAARPVSASLIDVSHRGIGVSLPVEVEEQFAASWGVRVGLALPDGQDPIVLDGEIRHRGLTGDEVHYGIEFEAPVRKDDARHGRLARYVEKRLDEMRFDQLLAAAHDPVWEERA